ncbi:MAG: VWA domain-containing protein [Acidobacteria bacterium]|nr:VWA domain-containing protein [Acidobacteriota bacterium]
MHLLKYITVFLLLTFFTIIGLPNLSLTKTNNITLQDNVIKIETNLVILNAAVTDSTGKAILNLKQTDFILEDEGKVQDIAIFKTETTPFATALLIDASGSMRNKLSRARVAAAQFAESMRVDDVTSVYSFSDKVKNLQEFSSSQDISPDVWELEAEGETTLYDAMYQALQTLSSRQELRRAIIVISDGGDSKSKRQEKEVLELALKTSASIYAIDIADPQDDKDSKQMISSGLLKNFADKTGGQYIKTLGGKQLSEKILDISKELRTQYTIGFYPEKENQGRKHRLSLKLVNRPNTQVRTRQSY